MSSRRDDAETMLDSDAVPSSLIEIAPILRAAKQFDISNPRVAYLCRFYAFEKSTRLDPTASRRGVRQFRTALLQRLEKEQETTYRERKAMSDAREMQNFYRDYFQKYIQDMKDDADKPDQRPQLAKTYQTAAILFEVLKAVDPKPEAVPDSENRDIMGSQIQAAVSALRNPKSDEKKENEDILDWLQAMFGFQKDNVDLALAEWTRIGVALAERASTNAQSFELIPPPPPPLYFLTHKSLIDPV